MSGTFIIIVAGGVGKRMGSDVPKQFLPLAGRPVIEWTLSTASSVPDIDGIILALPSDTPEEIKKKYLEFPKVLSVVEGGAQRQDSVCNALLAVPDDAKIVLVHDVVRPVASVGLFKEAARLAVLHGAVVPVIPVRDTVKVRGTGGIVVTRDRTEFLLAQTPQGFRVEILKEAYAEAMRNGYLGTDDAELVEAMGFPVASFPGEVSNLKVTLPEDMRMAAGLLEESDFRIGLGSDAHRLVENLQLWLGGVFIEDFPKGLFGHSDGDVLLHAIADAVYGALGDHDIGYHFPPGREETLGISSRDIMAHASSLIRENGYCLAGVDAVVICEEPKIAPLAEKLRNSIAGLLSAPVDRVSVKGKTTEGMGFEGRGEGISAMAVVLLRDVSKPDERKV